MATGPRNSAKEPINLNYFYGGTGIDPKLAPVAAFYSSRALDFRSVPSQMSVLPAPRAIATTLPDLIQGIEQDLNGVRWGVGSKGNLYRISTGDSVSVEATMTENGSAGIFYNQITDRLYIPGQTKVSLYGQVTTGNPGQPSWMPDIFAQSDSIVNGCTQVLNPNDGNFDGAFRSTASLAYPVPDTIIEETPKLTTFSPDIEPGYSIKVMINSVPGTPSLSGPTGTGSDVALGAGTVAWVNPGNITLSDDSYATADLTTGNNASHYLEATNFGFAVPSTATILGISVSIEKHVDSIAGTNCNTDILKLLKGGVATGTNKAASDPGWNPSTDQVATIGGTTDLWGNTLTPADINASNFGVALAVSSNAPSSAGQAAVDYVSITVYYTDNVTLTLHDALNTPLASASLLISNLTAGQFAEFVFGKQIRVLVGGGIASGAANYHFHLVSNIAGLNVTVVPASVGTANYATGDMQSLNFLWSAYRMVQTQNGWHPTAIFGVQTGTGNGQALCIGNGQYLSTYNFANDAVPSNNSWIRHQLVFGYGEEVCGLSVNNQYLVIATEKRSKVAGRTFQKGTLYFWDGTTPQPSSKIPIPMGAPYGLSTFNNITYFACAGSLFAWSGGQTVIKVRKLAYQNTDYLGTSDTTIVNPNMFTSRYNLLMMNYPTSTTNQNIDYGIWSWGTVELTFPNSFGYSYAPSHGFLNNTGSLNLQAGCCVNFVDSMYSSWAYTDSNGTHYGLDLLDNSSAAATSFSWKSLIYDGGSRYHSQIHNRLKVSLAALPAGSTITPFYINDRGSVVSGTTVTTGSTNALQEIQLRAHETQYGFTGTCPVGLTTPPTITGVTLEVDPLEEEVGVTNDG